jgi:hypothetical protein
MVMSKAKTVAAYLKELQPDRRAVISKVRNVVRRNLPKGYEELMGYGMIMWSVPLKRLPDTYNGHPLCYVALAAQKNYNSLYLMCVYGDAALRKQFHDAYKKSGKKLDIGQSCIRFKSPDDLALDLIGNAIASTSVETYIMWYEKSRKKA